MAKFRKKPVVIDAWQWNNDGAIAPPWVGYAFRDGTFLQSNGELQIMTLEDGKDKTAKHIATLGDWIIRGVKGEIYACKPDIFDMTYEAVPDE